MNHDGPHCIDFDSKKCPNCCLQSHKVRDIKNHPELIGTLIKWDSFKGTIECWLKPEKVEIESLRRGGIEYVQSTENYEKKDPHEGEE